MSHVPTFQPHCETTALRRDRASQSQKGDREFEHLIRKFPRRPDLAPRVKSIKIKAPAAYIGAGRGK